MNPPLFSAKMILGSVLFGCAFALYGRVAPGAPLFSWPNQGALTPAQLAQEIMALICLVGGGTLAALDIDEHNRWLASKEKTP